MVIFQLIDPHEGPLTFASAAVKIGNFHIGRAFMRVYMFLLYADQMSKHRM